MKSNCNGEQLCFCHLINPVDKSGAGMGARLWRYACIKPLKVWEEYQEVYLHTYPSSFLSIGARETLETLRSLCVCEQESN